MVKQQAEILTITEVAEYLKVAERTIYRLAASKKIPAFKVGGAWRFAKADIERWIREQTISTGDNRGGEGEGE
jgi:excisionase family DNA binding protein